MFGGEARFWAIVGTLIALGGTYIGARQLLIAEKPPQEPSQIASEAVSTPSSQTRIGDVTAIGKNSTAAGVINGNVAITR